MFDHEIDANDAKLMDSYKIARDEQGNVLMASNGRPFMNYVRTSGDNMRLAVYILVIIFMIVGSIVLTVKSSSSVQAAWIVTGLFSFLFGMLIMFNFSYTDFYDIGTTYFVNSELDENTGTEKLRKIRRNDVRVDLSDLNLMKQQGKQSEIITATTETMKKMNDERVLLPHSDIHIYNYLPASILNDGK